MDYTKVIKRQINFAKHLQKAMLLFVCITTSLCAIAQEKGISVSGTITDAGGESLIGVSVRVEGASVGTITDIDGKYQITVPAATSVLQFSYIGYVPVQETVGSRTIINLTMKEDSEVIDEVVVVGYATQRRANLTGAVSTVNVAKQLEGRPLTDVGRGLQGAVPGLTITTSSGRIGQTPKFRIRGVSGTLLDEEASKPLILVDGVEVSDLNLINPDDIEDVSVLKDAASSSIYGARASFGVILITTKSGQNTEKFTATYSNNFAWTSPIGLPKMAKSYESAAMALEAWQRNNPNDVEFSGDAGMKWDAEAIERMKEWDRNFRGMNLGPEMVAGRDFEMTDKGLRLYRSWDPFDMYIQNGFIQNHNLSVDGKSGVTNYHLGLGYMGNEGILKANPDSYDRYNVTFRTETEVTKWMKVRSQLMYAQTELETPFTYSTTTYDPLYYIYRWPSIYPYGTYNGVPFRSALAETEQANMNSDSKREMRLNLGTTLKFTKDLSLDANYTYTTTNRLRQLRGGSVTAIDFWGGNINNVVTYTSPTYDKYDQYNYVTDRHTANAVLRYNKEFEKNHKLSAFAGWDLEYEKYNEMNGESRGLLEDGRHAFDLTTGKQPDGTAGQFVYGEEWDWASVGFFGRINYSFKDRYLLELNGRYDGSSKFPPRKLWGFFPSASAGWIFSEEAFMQSLQPVLSFGKIRGSVGSIGNPNIGLNKFRAIMERVENSGWIIKDNNEATFNMPRALARDFTWENIITRNLGLDLRFLKNEFGVSFDVYRRINDGMVVSGTRLPAVFGIETEALRPIMNLGELTTNGWELALDYNHTFANDLRLRANFNISDSRSVITDYPSPDKSLKGLNYNGRVLGEIWGFETDRFFTEEDFNPDGSLLSTIPNQNIYLAYSSTSGISKFLPGDIKYKDLDGNGEINTGAYTLGDHGDLKVIGNTSPRYEYSGRIGVDYKGFDLDLFFQGVGSRQIWATGNLVIPGFQFGDGVYYANQTDYWRPDNRDAFYPRLTRMNQPGRYTDGGGNFMPQSKYLLDMSYIRLKNITFGYSLPKKLLQKITIQNVRVYVSAENLFTIDNLGDIPLDPETNTSDGDGGAQGFGRIYPYVKTYSAGLQVTF